MEAQLSVAQRSGQQSARYELSLPRYLDDHLETDAFLLRRAPELSVTLEYRQDHEHDHYEMEGAPGAIAALVRELNQRLEAEVESTMRLRAGIFRRGELRFRMEQGMERNGVSVSLQ